MPYRSSHEVPARIGPGSVDQAMTSLKGRVALWLLPPLFLLLAANAVSSYRGAREAADLAYDRSLQMALMFLGEHLTTSGETATWDLPRSIREVLGNCLLYTSR